jgi:aspartyl-tRNA(Asn)/glutamyl-tRNA(Gln) amidotransferase subunit A
LAEVDQAVSPALFTRAANYLGLCALAVPSGLTAQGLPTSLQVVARGGDEAMAVRIAAAIEAAQPPAARPDLPL